MNTSVERTERPPTTAPNATRRIGLMLFLGGFVSLLGCLLVGIGGWLRYHPTRPNPSRALAPFAEVPAER